MSKKNLLGILAFCSLLSPLSASALTLEEATACGSTAAFRAEEEKARSIRALMDSILSTSKVEQISGHAAAERIAASVTGCEDLLKVSLNYGKKLEDTLRTVDQDLDRLVDEAASGSAR